MSDALLDLCLADICRGSKVGAFAADPAGTVAAYGLTPRVQDELVRADVRALLARGAHPVLVMYLARSRGVTGPAYLAAVAP